MRGPGWTGASWSTRSVREAGRLCPRAARGRTPHADAAAMAIGLRRGRADTMEEGQRELAVAREFRRRFEAEMETISCRELTGADLTTEEGLEQFMRSDTPQTVCFPAVGVAYRLVVDLLKETP